MFHLDLKCSDTVVAFAFAVSLFMAGARKSPAAGAGETPDVVSRLIQLAGNTSDEIERLRLLRQLEGRSDLPGSLREDLARLLPTIEQWANGRAHLTVDSSRAAENGYLCRFIDGKVRPAAEGPVVPAGIGENSPLHPIWCLYRGRMLVWRVIQSGPLLRVSASREAYYSEGRRCLEAARTAFPDNRVVRMYLGEPIPWPKQYETRPDAPEWANLQREGLEKLTDLIHWWIDERQLDDGQFGGGWGDDVEMWRWWTPILIGFDDSKVNAAQERLSSGIFRQPHLKAGFTSRVTDVEHSNEDTTDTILPMMHLRPEDPLWKQRAVRLAELMRERWTGRNRAGFLQFKSIYFSVDRVEANPARAFDTVYHPSVVQPSLLCWQRTGDPALTDLFGEWLKLWVDAAARADNGKPAGILPSAIHWPDGKIGAAGQPWWQPFSPGHNDALYNWPGATRLMTSSLLLAFQMTRDERYLEPVRSMAAIRMRHPGGSAADAPAPGSEAWCAQHLGGFLPDTLAKYRFLTGDTRYDSLLRTDASGYVQYRLTGEDRALVRALRRNAEAFRSNWEAYTSEMRWTDRVLSFTRNFLRYLPEPAPPSPSPEILYATATGDPGNAGVCPLNAVRWLTPPRGIAALVVESTRTSFRSQLFHFGAEPRSMGAELFLLDPGQYQLSMVNQETGDRFGGQVIEVRAARTRVSFTLPPRVPCAIELKRETPGAGTRP